MATATQQLNDTFAALSDPTRRAILGRLMEGEASVAELTQPFEMSQPAISKHLKYLERAGLVSRHRDAQRRMCRLEAAPMAEAVGWLEGYREHWEANYSRLDALLEEMQAPDTTEEIVMTAEPTLIVSTPAPTDLSVERVFNAPARLVWDAHTKPELVRQWLLGPDGWDMPVCDIDLRLGGTYRYEWSHPEQPSFGTGGEFTEVTPTSRLVTTERMDGFDSETLSTMTLVETDGRTTLTLLMRFESQEIRDAAAATGMADGIGQSFDRLEAAMRDRPAS